jgi:21S rRNA (GM2251-2'-O)-methyltransferase
VHIIDNMMLRTSIGLRVALRNKQFLQVCATLSSSSHNGDMDDEPSSRRQLDERYRRGRDRPPMRERRERRGPPQSREGDWTCTSCGYLNYAFRGTWCGQCNMKRDDAPHSNDNKYQEHSGEEPSKRFQRRRDYHENHAEAGSRDDGPSIASRVREYSQRDGNRDNSGGSSNWRSRGDGESRQRNTYQNVRNYDRSRRTDGPHSGNYNSSDMGRDRAQWGEWDGDHLFGLSPVKAALLCQKRTMKELFIKETFNTANEIAATVDNITITSDDADDLLAKARYHSGVSEVVSIAENAGIPVRRVTKHALNMLTGGNKTNHQGVVLRATHAEYINVTKGGILGSDDLPLSVPSTTPLVLALDELHDPMNLGALLRSAHYLGAHGVVVTAKNSAPLSSTVSKASSGAMELMQIHNTTNMMRFLDDHIENGWNVIGTALTDDAVDIKEVALHGKPTILVLGNEGHGIRTNILNRCTHLVKIPRGNHDIIASTAVNVVDSLNVSVTGAILMNSLLTKIY